MPAHDKIRQVMTPGGQFMTEIDRSCRKGMGPDFFCSVLSPQHSVLIILGFHP